MGSFDLFGWINDYAAVGAGVDCGCFGGGGVDAGEGEVRGKMGVGG